MDKKVIDYDKEPSTNVRFIEDKSSKYLNLDDLIIAISNFTSDLIDKQSLIKNLIKIREKKHDSN